MTPMLLPQPRMVDVEAVAHAFSTTNTTIYRWMKEGMPSYKVGGRRLFDVEECVTWVKSHSRWSVTNPASDSDDEAAA